MNQIAFVDMGPTLSTGIDMGVVLKGITTMSGALDLCIRSSGRDPKMLYLDLAIDKGHWSRMLSGQAHFPHDKLEALMDLCGNDIPLQWLAWRRGKGLHLLESEQQRLMREKDDQNRALQQKVDLLMEIVRGKVPA